MPFVQGYRVKNLLRYLKRTINQMLRFSPRGSYDHMVVYPDADSAYGKSDPESILAVLLSSWSSKEERAVLMSDCKSEYVAFSAYNMQDQCFAQLLWDMSRKMYISPDVNMVHMLRDNIGGIAFTMNLHLNERSKHIDIYYHYVYLSVRPRLTSLYFYLNFI
jgi:hypothetical protein